LPTPADGDGHALSGRGWSRVGRPLGARRGDRG
jgi:hypothetical protein